MDTNVVSELRKSKPHGGVLAWVQAVPAIELHLSAMTIGVIQTGIELTRERDAAKAMEIENWLDQMHKSFKVLTVDAQVFKIWARLKHRKSQVLFQDALIAATAIRYDLTVVTRNVADFESFDVPLFNPFSR